MGVDGGAIAGEGLRIVATQVWGVGTCAILKNHV